MPISRRRFAPSLSPLESRVPPSDAIGSVGGVLVGPGPGTAFVAITAPEWGEGGSEGDWGPSEPQDEMDRLRAEAAEAIHRLGAFPGIAPEWGDGGAGGSWGPDLPEPPNATRDPVPPEAPGTDPDLVPPAPPDPDRIILG